MTQTPTDAAQAVLKIPEADMERKPAEQFLAAAAHKLSEPEHEETRRELAIFVDYWGLDAYTPPHHVEARVREIVKGFVTAAQIIAGSEAIRHGVDERPAIEDTTQ